ncbi:hypothetical protein CBL_10574 [Carabus blaptoides fortunei]
MLADKLTLVQGLTATQTRASLQSCNQKHTPYSPIEEIQEALEEEGLQIRNVSNIRRWKTKEPLKKYRLNHISQEINEPRKRLLLVERYKKAKKTNKTHTPNKKRRLN